MNMAAKPNALVYYGPCDSRAPLRDERESLIQQQAYYKALKRNFAPGHELEDWLGAEQEMDEWFKRLPPNSKRP
jgi:hypothetical protein